jgi:hypothetical protein
MMYQLRGDPVPAFTRRLFNSVFRGVAGGALLLSAACSGAAAPATPPAAAPTVAPAAAPTAPPPTTTSAAKPAAAAPTAAPAAAPTAAPAAAAAPGNVDFQNRTIHLVVGYAAGGGFDATARVLAPYLSQALPGNPTVVVENQVGADSLLAARSVLSAPPRGQDISVVIFIATLLARSQLTNGIDGFQVEKEAVFLGKPDATATQLGLCAHTEKIQNLDQFLGLSTPIKVGGLNGTSLYDTLLRWTQDVGLPIDPVFGYAATAQLTLAFNQGEVDATPSCRDLDLAQNPDWLDKGQITPLFYWDAPSETIKKAQADGKFPWYKNVLDVKQVSADQKDVLQTWLSINRGSNVYAVSKQTPADTTAALRQAFKQAVQNPEFKAAMDQRQLAYGYMPPEDIDQSVVNLDAASTSARDLMKRMLAQ